MARTMIRKRSDAVAEPSPQPQAAASAPFPGTTPPGAPVNAVLRRSEANAIRQRIGMESIPEKVPEAWGGARVPEKLPEPEFARAGGDGALRAQEWAEVAEMVHAVGAPAQRLKELQRSLQVDAEQTWRANPVVRAELANSAKALYVAAKLEVKRRELDRQQVEAAARTQARAALQEEADRGNRKGVISAAEIEAKVSLDYPDEYRSWELQKTRDKGLVEFLESFALNLSQTIRGGGP
jgi:hypothetical protein